MMCLTKEIEHLSLTRFYLHVPDTNGYPFYPNIIPDVGFFCLKIDMGTSS